MAPSETTDGGGIASAPKPDAGTDKTTSASSAGQATAPLAAGSRAEPLAAGSQAAPFAAGSEAPPSPTGQETPLSPAAAEASRCASGPASFSRRIADFLMGRRRRPIGRWRRLWLRFCWCVVGTALVGMAVVGWMGCRMPGQSFRGALPAMSGEERRLSAALQDHVRALAGEIGERNFDHMPALRRAEDWVEAQLREAGYEPARLDFRAWGQTYPNIEAVKTGGDAQAGTVVIGAHYDSAPGTPGPTTMPRRWPR